MLFQKGQISQKHVTYVTNHIQPPQTVQSMSERCIISSTQGALLWAPRVHAHSPHYTDLREGKTGECKIYWPNQHAFKYSTC